MTRFQGSQPAKMGRSRRRLSGTRGSLPAWDHSPGPNAGQRFYLPRCRLSQWVAGGHAQVAARRTGRAIGRRPFFSCQSISGCRHLTSRDSFVQKFVDWPGRRSLNHQASNFREARGKAPSIKHQHPEKHQASTKLIAHLARISPSLVKPLGHHQCK